MPNAVVISFDAVQAVVDLLARNSSIIWNHSMIFKVMGLFVVTAIAEIIGCYFPYLWLKRNGSTLLLIPAAISLSLFVWLLTLHPAASGRVYAAYGGVYIAVALAWLWKVDHVKPTLWDVVGTVIVLLGTLIIVIGGWRIKQH